MQTAYEKLQDEEVRIFSQIETLKTEIEGLRNQEFEQQLKIDKAIMAGKSNTFVLEDELEKLGIERRRKEHQLEVLQQPMKGNQLFIKLAQKALAELAIDAKAINDQWNDLITQLQNAFDVYLRVCSKFKDLEHEASRLNTRIDHARSFLPKGTTIDHIETVPTRTVTNLQKPGAPDSLDGPIWMCARRQGLMKIKDAFEGMTPELKMEQAQRDQAAMDDMRNKRVRRAPALVQEPEPQTQENSVHAGQAHLRNVHAPQTQN